MIASRSIGKYCCRFAAAAALLWACPAFAQQFDGTLGLLPLAQQQSSSSTSQNQQDQETEDQKKQEQAPDRIFGILPNYSTVNGTAQLPPLTAKQKFKLVAQGAFDPYEFFIVGVLAAKSQAEDDDEAWGQGVKGYAKRYAAGFADQAIGNFMTGAVYPSLLHQDPRYYRLGRGGFWHRAFYATTRVIVTRGDSGAKQFDYSEFLGDASGAGIATLYHTKANRNLSGVGETFSTQIAVDALGNVLKEFWPDVRKKLHWKQPPSPPPLVK